MGYFDTMEGSENIAKIADSLGRIADCLDPRTQENGEIKIVLGCPDCSHTGWLRTEDGNFVCTGCGAVTTPETMVCICE